MTNIFELTPTRDLLATPFGSLEIASQTFRDNMAISAVLDPDTGERCVAVTIGADDVPAPTLLFTPDEFEHAARFFVALSRRPDHLIPLARFFSLEARS